MSAPLTRSGDLFRVVALVGGHREEGVAFVFVVYLDDSDAEQSSVLTLAGYAAPIGHWVVFERIAGEFLDKHGIEILHAKEFHDTKGAFQGWSEVKKNELVDGLYDIAEPLVTFGISRSIHKVAYRQRQAELGRNKSTSAYGVLFATILHTLVRGTSISDKVREFGVSFVVESGHNNNEEIEKYFHHVKGQEVFAGAAKSITFAGQGDSRAIQLADFFAFYSRRAAARADAMMDVVQLGADAKPNVRTDRIMHRFVKRVPHFFNVTRDPYGGQIQDWRETEFIPDRPPGPLPSEVPVEPKRPKQRQRRRGRDRQR